MYTRHNRRNQNNNKKNLGESQGKGEGASNLEIFSPKMRGLKVGKGEGIPAQDQPELCMSQIRAVSPSK